MNEKWHNKENHLSQLFYSLTNYSEKIKLPFLGKLCYLDGNPEIEATTASIKNTIDQAKRDSC